MSIQSSQQLEIKWLAILRASQELIDAAQEARWNDLPMQAEYRDKLIRDYFAKPLTVDNALQAQEQIHKILAMDEQLLGMARKEQEETKVILKNLRTGTTAIKAYQS